MKDIYEVLNDIDIDQDEIELMEVSDIEKMRVKKYLKNSINKNKVFKKKRIVVAAFVCLVIGGTGIFGTAYPSYAAEIPIVGDIFRFIDNGRTGAYDKYKEYADVIGMTQESNGIKVTIKEAIFDGRTLTYTYEIVSDKDLGEDPFLSMKGPSIVIKDYSGGTGGGSIVKRVGNNTYVGEEDISIDEERKSLRFELNFTSIGDMNSADSIPINGEWKFKINLKALDNVKQVLNKETEKDGAKLVISSISKTPASFTLNCTQEISKEIRDKYFMIENPILEVKDDLGNSYTSTRDLLIEDRMYWVESTVSFGALNPNATKLIITPKLSFTNDVHSAKANSDGQIIKISPVIDENHPINGEIILDDIVIDLEK